MDAAQETFISSTYFTERIAFAATIKAIEVYERERVWEKQIKYGQMIKNGWETISKKYNIPLKIGGIDPLPHFDFVCEQPLVYKTFFIQEMLKKGYLASNAYLDAFDNVFERMKDILIADDLGNYLDGPVCQSGFERLN